MAEVLHEAPKFNVGDEVTYSTDYSGVIQVGVIVNVRPNKHPDKGRGYVAYDVCFHNLKVVRSVPEYYLSIKALHECSVSRAEQALSEQVIERLKELAPHKEYQYDVKFSPEQLTQLINAMRDSAKEIADREYYSRLRDTVIMRFYFEKKYIMEQALKAADEFIDKIRGYGD